MSNPDVEELIRYNREAAVAARQEPCQPWCGVHTPLGFPRPCLGDCWRPAYGPLADVCFCTRECRERAHEARRRLFTNNPRVSHAR